MGATLSRLHWRALFPEQAWAAAFHDVSDALRPVIRYVLSARRAARDRAFQNRVHWEELPRDRTLRLEPLDTLVVVPAEGPALDGPWPAPVRHQRVVGGEVWVVLAGRGDRGLPHGAVVMAPESGSTRLVAGDWSADWSGGELVAEEVPPSEIVTSDTGVRFRWTERPRRGTWVQLLVPEDLDADRTVDPRAAFVEDSVREVRRERGGPAIRVLGRRREDYRLELAELPPSGTRITLPVNLAVLEREVAAVHTLRDEPRPWHQGLLRLGMDPAHAAWPWVTPEHPDRWYLLDDPSIDGTEEQREFVRRALGTPDFVFLDGPPGSGKTHAITELVIQLVDRGLRVLLCSSANVAVDNVLERLAGRYPQVRPVRIGFVERVSPPVRASALHVQVEGVLDAWQCNPELAGLPEDEARRAATRMVLASANLVAGTTTGLTGEPVVGEAAEARPFDVLILDEASRATFPEFLVPALLATRHVVVGDPRQLPPFLERADLEAALADLADPGGNRLTPAAQRAALLTAWLERSDAGAVDWLVAEPSPVLDVMEEEARGRRWPDVVRVVRGQAAPGRVSIADLRAGRGELALLAASVVLVSEDLLDEVAPFLPSRLEWLGRAPGAPWSSRVAALGHPKASDTGGDPGSTGATLRKDLAERTWAGEVAWRTDRVHQLERSRDAGDRQRREDEIRRLLPLWSAPWVGDAVAELRDLGIRSVIECVEHGAAVRRSRSQSPLGQGMPQREWDERSVRLTWQHRMHRGLSAFPRQLAYDRRALRDAATLEGREARLGWSLPLDGDRRRWLDVRGRDERDQAPAEADAIGEALESLLAWMAEHPCRVGRPWEVACLSPYVNQEILLRKVLRRVTGQQRRETRFSAPNVELSCATVDRFQGREADVVLLALRNQRKPGHVDSPNRLNVAITRARLLLVLVGSRSHWERFRVDEISRLLRSTPPISLEDLP